MISDTKISPTLATRDVARWLNSASTMYNRFRGVKSYGEISLFCPFCLNRHRYWCSLLVKACLALILRAMSISLFGQLSKKVLSSSQAARSIVLSSASVSISSVVLPSPSPYTTWLRLIILPLRYSLRQYSATRQEAIHSIAISDNCPPLLLSSLNWLSGNQYGDG